MPEPAAITEAKTKLMAKDLKGLRARFVIDETIDSTVARTNGDHITYSDSIFGILVTEQLLHALGHRR